ncbi:MAG: TonB-dependent receptor [Bryobacteraceae bacterium]|nr:TonB-dependent receptor [Bryobacteraceae bacterium]
MLLKKQTSPLQRTPRSQFAVCAALALALVALSLPSLCTDHTVSGRILDPQGKVVPGASVLLQAGSSEVARTATDRQGRFLLAAPGAGSYRLSASALGFQTSQQEIIVPPAGTLTLDLTLPGLAGQHDSIVITARTLEPTLDLRNAEVFNRTLFARDDQMIEQLNAGINAGQHEGGGKSLEIRRFGFNLDHGGTNGGLKVLVDDIQQNQGTQGHGQGYLGALKAISPELIQEVTIINGPFSPEYGDFSGLGVVHIRQRESLPDEYTVRLQGGNFNTGRGFLAFSPDAEKIAAYLAYEGSYTDGPFTNPARYRRDNVNANFTKTLSLDEKLGFRFLFGRNDFYSSGQLPVDLISEGLLDRFGFIDPTHGGKVKLGTASVYYSKLWANGDTFKADGFLSRSLFDLYSNFTMFLNDPVNGDAIQQHDSRLQEGLNAQYTHPHQIGSNAAVFVAGGNFHDNQINVGLYPREGRTPTGINTRANAHVTNGAGYVQENLSLWRGKLLLGGGLRFDEFRYDVADRVSPELSGVQAAGRWQAKGSAALTPSQRIPVTFTANYGRGINSIDARGVVQRPDEPRLATTDFYQAGASSNFSRLGISADVFLIDHSNEQVYIPDDGSFEFKGPSRAYGFETKASIAVTRNLSLNGGLTKIGNAFFRGGDSRVYVDSAPHFVANAALTLVAWHGWSGSLRMRAINHYRLDGEDPSILASGHTVFDLGVAKQIRRGLELNFSLDNLTDRDYYETQNYFESRVSPGAPALWRIHATPGYPLTAVVGLTLRFRGK